MWRFMGDLINYTVHCPYDCNIVYILRMNEKLKTHANDWRIILV